MNKYKLPALVILSLALVAAVGSRTFLGACVHEDGGFGACHWACQALLGESVLTAFLAAFALALAKERPGLYLAVMPASILGILTPGTLIDLCRMPAMRCRAIMRPAMVILFSGMLLAALAGWLLSRKEAR